MAKSHIVSPGVFARNLFSNWVGMTAEIVVAFFLTPFIVNSLGAAVYGIWSLVNSLVGYMGLIDLGIRGSVGRYINHYMARDEHERVNEVILTSGFFFTLIGLVISGIAYVIAYNFHILFDKTPPELLSSIVIVLPLMAISLWLSMLTSAFRNIFIALERFEINNAISLLVLLLKTAGVIVVLRSHYGFLGLALVVFATNLIAAVIFVFAAKRLYNPLRFSPHYVSRQRFSEIWKFGIASFITRTAGQLIYQTDSIIIMIFLGPTMVAVYNIASMVIQYGQKLVEQIGGTFYPSIMKSGSLNDLSGLQRIFVWHARLAFYFGGLVYIGFVVFGGQFINLWIGPDYAQATRVMTILCLAELVSIFGSVGGSVLFSLDKIRFQLTTAIGEAVANVILSLMFIGLLDLGMEGVALGTLVSMSAARIFIHPSYTTAQIGMNFKKYILSIGARVGLLTLVSFTFFSLIVQEQITPNWASFFTQVAVAVIIYLPVAALIMFPTEEFALIRSKVLARIGMRF